MKGVIVLLITLMLLSSLSACTETPQEILPQSLNTTNSLSTELPTPADSSDILLNDESGQIDNEVEGETAYSEIDKIILHWSGRFPPQSQEDDAANPEHYSSETMFFPDGRVEHIEKTYYGYELKSVSWQMDSENFITLVGILEGKAFLSLPERFSYGAFDEPAYTLSVHIGDTLYQSAYTASTGSNEDVQSYTVLMDCFEAFRKLTNMDDNTTY